MAERPTIELHSLCVDLDGTLIRTDSLVECVLNLLRRPYQLMRIPFWLLRGRAYLKKQLSTASNLDVSQLPYNEELVEYCREQRRKGRGLVLATAADISVARGVADHLGFFDAVIASDGVVNMKGGEKQRQLSKHFGSDGFSYAGNSSVDLDIWSKCDGAVVVGSSRLMKAAMNVTTIERWFRPKYRAISELVRALRPHQWVKNLLVFVPMVTANALGDMASWWSAFLVFLAMSFAASATYVLNDLVDIRSDRKHPVKRQRPFARGSLSPLIGLAVAMTLLGLAVVLSEATETIAFLSIYVLVSVVYSVKLKELLLVDIFTLAFLYCLRIFVGGAATGHEVSLWLFAYSAFLFFSLACVKRVAEVADFGTEDGSRRAYTKDDFQLLSAMGLASTFASAVVLALYIQEQMKLEVYAQPIILWAIVPLLTFWQCRLWFSTTRGYIKEDPILYAARDWVSQLVAAVAVLLLVLAHTGY